MIKEGIDVIGALRKGTEFNPGTELVLGGRSVIMGWEAGRMCLE